MPDPSLSDLMTLRDELAQRQAEVEQRISAAKEAERQAAIEAVLQMMAAHGLTPDDLRRAARLNKPKGLVPSKLDPKYRDPATGQVWTGRGRKPGWLRAAVEAGRSLKEFAV